MNRYLLRKLLEESRSRLIEYHHSRGNEAYAGGNPENIDEAIEFLGGETEALIKLEAQGEAQDLETKREALEILSIEDQIEAERIAISEATPVGSPIIQLQSTISHYKRIHELYVGLIELDHSRDGELHDNLEKLIQLRLSIANQLLEGSEPNYEEAIKQYEAIYKLGESFQAAISAFNINPQDEISKLREEADYAAQYAQLEDMISNKEFDKVAEEIEEKFVRPGFYYKQSLSLLEAVLYAKKHGHMPPSWGLDIESLNRRLLKAAEKRVRELKEALQPWSNISEAIDAEKKLLLTYKYSISSIKEMTGIESCRDELQDLNSEIENLRNALHIDLSKTALNLEQWLRRIREIEIRIQESDPTKNNEELFGEVDRIVEEIVSDKMFTTFQNIQAQSTRIAQDMDKIKTEVLAQHIEVLQECQTSLQQRLEKLEKQRKFTYILIPISLIPVLIVGGIIGLTNRIITPDLIQNTLVIRVISVVAILFWIGSFICFVWIYSPELFTSIIQRVSISKVLRNRQGSVDDQ
jgi:hypothetical protein